MATATFNIRGYYGGSVSLKTKYYDYSTMERAVKAARNLNINALADFLKNLFSCEFLISSDYPTEDFSINVAERYDKAINLKVSSKNGTTIYSGLFKDFVAPDTKFDLLNSAIGRLVRFDYNPVSGSSENGVRVVQVSKVVMASNGNHVLLHGKDLVKNEERCYRSDRINGDIEVLSAK